MFILLLHRSYIIFGIYINIIFFHVPKLSINIYKNSFRGSCELDGLCIFRSLSKTHPNPKHLPPPPTTISDHHEPSPFATRLLHREEHFNCSGISKTKLENSVENEAFNHPFTVSSR